MKRYFKVKNVKKLDEMKEGDEIPTSDFAQMSPSGNFVQWELIEEDVEEVTKMDVHPGIFTIVKTMTGLKLETTSFTQDRILKEFVQTAEVVDKVDCFFRNLHKYKEFGIEVPKRGVFLWGEPGTGKSTIISSICEKYSQNKDTLVLIWDTTKYEAHNVKDLVKAFNYINIKKMILIIEDIGGVEMDQRRMAADSSLLSLLDNQEKTFTVPTCIIATTNHPENFMASLTNRSGRFDDKIKVGYPPGEARAKLLDFFSKGTSETEAITLIASKECEKFPPAHIKEVVIRSAIHEKTHLQVIKEMLKEIKTYEKGFNDTSKGMGFLND